MSYTICRTIYVVQCMSLVYVVHYMSYNLCRTMYVISVCRIIYVVHYMSYNVCRTMYGIHCKCKRYCKQIEIKAKCFIGVYWMSPELVCAWVCICVYASWHYIVWVNIYTDKSNSCTILSIECEIIFFKHFK